jgi:hypothetical protein
MGQGLVQQRRPAIGHRLGAAIENMRQNVVLGGEVIMGGGQAYARDLREIAKTDAIDARFREQRLSRRKQPVFGGSLRKTRFLVSQLCLHDAPYRYFWPRSVMTNPVAQHPL